MPSLLPSRRALAAGILTLTLGVPAALAPAALAGPIRARYDYAFTATQAQGWGYDNMRGPSECDDAPARGGGTQKATFSAAGKGVDVTTDLARNVKKASFNIPATGQGVYERQGAFAIQYSAIGGCAKPDVTLGTQGCGADRETVFMKMVLQFDGTLEVGGEGGASNQPFADDSSAGSGITCPFMFYFSRGFFMSFVNDEGISHDMSSGLLGTETKVTGKQFFKRKRIVLRGARTQIYQPTAPTDDAFGFVAQSAISWTLTLTPAKKRR